MSLRTSIQEEINLREAEIIKLRGMLETIKDIHDLTDENLSTVIRRVEAESKISLEEMKGKSRKAEIVKARTALISGLFNECGFTKSAIGRMLNRDHSTVIHALRKP